MHQLIIRQVSSTKKRLFTVERMRSEGAKTAPAVALSDPANYPVAGGDAKLLNELAWYLENYLDYPFGPNEERAARAIAALHVWGQESFERLFGQGQGRDFYRDSTRDGHASLDLVIASDDPGVLGWPWEALRDPLIGDLAHHSRIERHLMKVEDPPPQHSGLSRDRIGILLVTARPYDHDVGFRSISRPLVNLIQDRKLPAEVKLLRPPTFAQLRTELEGHPGAYHIVHFDGHGGFGSGSASRDRFTGPRGHLVFEKVDGSEDLISGEQLSQLLREHRIPIAVLNACQSAMIGIESDSPFASVATSLLRAGVRSVVAMGYSLYVSAAKEFLPAFYDRLFRAGNVSEATRAGRQAMLADPERRPGFVLQDWMVPVLYQQEPLALDFLDASTGEMGAVPIAIPDGARFDPSENPHGLIGRDSAVLALERASRRKPAGLLVHGLGGVGKTTLARGYVEWLANTQGLTHLPVWISFQGIRYVDYVFNRLAEEVLGTDALAIPSDEKIQLLRNALRDHARLVIWDNFESASGGADVGTDDAMSGPDRQQLKRFLEALHGGKSKILITSRSDEAWLGPTACFRVPLGGLIGEERQELARAILEDQGIRLDPRNRDTADLIEMLEGHPLMMRAILPRLSGESPQRLMAVLDSYVPEAESSNEVERKVYATLRYIEEGFPSELRPLLVPLSFHAKFVEADVLGHIAAAAGQPYTSAETQKAMELLEAAGLAQGVGNNVYQLHPALTRYLEARAPIIAAGAAEVTQWEKAFADVMASVAQSVSSKPLHEQQPAFALFGGSFNRALRLAAGEGWPIEIFGALTQAFASYATNQRNFPIARRYFESLAERVGEIGLDEALAGIFHQLGFISQEEREFDTAKYWYQKGLALAESLNDDQGVSGAYHQLGVLAHVRRHYDEADNWYRKSMEMAEKLGDEQSLATSYQQLGTLARARGDLNGAERWYQQALELKEKAGDPIAIAGVRHQMGIVAFLREDLPQAIKCFLSAASSFEQFGDHFNAGKSLHQLGMAALHHGDPHAAEAWLLKSLKKWEQLGDEAEAASTCTLLGVAKASQGDRPTGIAWLRKALDICERHDLIETEPTRALLGKLLDYDGNGSDR